MFISNYGWSAKAFVKLTTGYSLNQTATWADQNSSDQTEVMVFTDKGLVKAKLAAIPFDFDALEMQAHPK